MSSFRRLCNEPLPAARANFRDPDQLAELVLRHYAFCIELSWKSLRDLLAWNGTDAKLPCQVIKQVFATDVISNSQLWIEMLEDRPEFTADGERDRNQGSDDARAQLAVAAKTVAEIYVRELQAFCDNRQPAGRRNSRNSQTPWRSRHEYRHQGRAPNPASHPKQCPGFRTDRTEPMTVRQSQALIPGSRPARLDDQRDL